MKIPETSVGGSASAGFFPEPETPCCACVTTHAVFVSWWPLAAVRFMSLIPGSAPSIHFAAALSSQPNIKLLPIAQNAVSQGDVCVWHHVLSGDQPEMNNRCPWRHHCCSMSLQRLSILCSLFNSLLLQTADVVCKRAFWNNVPHLMQPGHLVHRQTAFARLTHYRAVIVSFALSKCCQEQDVSMLE